MESNECDLDKICRICISSDNIEMKSLFSATLQFGIDDKEIIIADFIRKLTELEIFVGDGLPPNLCSTCSKKLSEVSDLIRLCISSDQILKSSIKNHKTIELSEETDDNGDECLTIITKSTNKVVRKRNKRTSKINKYRCSICYASFCNKLKFEKHKKSHDSSDSPNLFKCDECAETFTKKLYLNVHSRSHVKDEDKKFGCSNCNRQFAYEYLLKQHEFKHSDTKPFPCTHCAKGCLTAESLKRHMKVHDENYVRKRHACRICSKDFAYPSFLSEHMKNHTGEKPHLCSTCGKGFRQSGALHYHQRMHSGYKPFTCKVCQNNFMSRSILKVHMRKHTDERPYICHVCGVAFRQSTDLRSHYRTHSGDRPVLCTICGKRMSTTGQLTIHIRSHTGEKPFVCNTCSKAFTTRTMLVKHERIHTGERPYVCDVCGKAFNQSGTLKTHKNTHNGDNRGTKRSRKKMKREELNIVTNITAAPQEFVGRSQCEENVKAEFTVVLPAPIPLLHNL